MIKGLTINTDNTFSLRVSKVDSDTGKRRFIQRTYAIAKIKQADTLRKQLQIELHTNKQHTTITTLGEYLDRWLMWCLESGRNRQHVTDRNRLDLRDWVLPYIGAVKIRNLNTQTLIKWQEQITAKRKADGTDYSRKTRAKVWRILRSAINAAPSLIGETLPIQNFRYSPTGKAPKTRTWLDKEQLKTFLANTNNYPYPKAKALILLMFTTGARIGELAALTWDDIKEDHIVISKSVSNGDLNTTKTGIHRTAPLLAPIKTALLIYKQHYPPGKPNLVFYTAKDGTGYLTPTFCNKHILKLSIQSGIDAHISPHDARRTINNTLRLEANSLVAMSVLGHVTQQMHNHYSQPSTQEAATALSDLLEDAEQVQ